MWCPLRYLCKCYNLLKIKEKQRNQGGCWRTQEWVVLKNVESASLCPPSIETHVDTLSAGHAGVAGLHRPKVPLPPVQPTFARLDWILLTWPGWLGGSWRPPCRASGWQTCWPPTPSSPPALNQAVIGLLCWTTLILGVSGAPVVKAIAPLASRSHTSPPLAPR